MSKTEFVDEGNPQAQRWLISLQECDSVNLVFAQTAETAKQWNHLDEETTGKVISLELEQWALPAWPAQDLLPAATC